MSSMSKFKKLAGISAFAFAAMTMANSVNAANWRYAHEEYEGDVQDVFAYKFKEYIEDNSDHTCRYTVSASWVSLTTSWSKPRQVF